MEKMTISDDFNIFGNKLRGNCWVVIQFFILSGGFLSKSNPILLSFWKKLKTAFTCFTGR